ncbi:response regulator transcription factor [Streptosporangium sp. NBC_01639]|uniref:response regulator transcription factor n=1 Tax=Streptosporangium sp. NBC_01639 TaxID=2975948 RepID=UPI0038662CC5|nr:response regulator transcription factor [Streptosporangium sp. NBC_01639]
MKNAAQKKTVLLAESRTLLRIGLREIVHEAGDMAVAGETTDSTDTIRSIRDLAPEVVVMGPLTDCADSVEATRKIAAEVSSGLPRFLALVDVWDARSFDVTESEVGGLLFTNASAEELRAAIRMLSAGYSFLAPETYQRAVRAATAGPRTPPVTDMTSRELEVLRLLARGYTNAEISRDLSLSESTVKSHVQNVLHKKHLRNRAGAVIYAYETGLTKVGENLAHLSRRAYPGGERNRVANS